MPPKTIVLSEREELRIEVRRWKGRPYAQVRVYAAPNPEEAKWPTGKGFLVPLSRLGELREALAGLENESKELCDR